MKRYQFLKILIYLTLLENFVSCKGEENNIKIIKEYLNIALPNGVSSFKSANGCLDYSYKKPCIFFCSFSISKKDFINWMNETKVPVVNSSFLAKFCNNDQQVLNMITNLNLRGFARANSYKWWNPSQCNYRTAYAAFYNSQSKHHSAFNGPWDGRILIVYCESKSVCHLIVETFL